MFGNHHASHLGAGSAPPGIDAPVTKPKFGPQVVWHAIRNWWLLATPPGLILALLAVGAIWLLFEPVYRATGLLRITAREYVAFPTQEELHRFVKSQVEFIRSRVVLNQVLTEPAIARLPEVSEEEDPLEYLAKNIAVQSLGGSDLFEIRFDSPSAEASTRIVNAVLDAYLRTQRTENDDQAVRLISILEDELAARRGTLNQLKARVRDLAKNLGPQDSLVQTNKRQQEVESAALTTLGEIHRQLLNSEVSRGVLEVQLRIAKSRLEGKREDEVPEYMIDQALAELPEAKSLEEAIALKRINLHEHSAAGGEDVATVRILQEQIGAFEKKLAELKESSRERVAADMQERLRRLRKSELFDLETQITNAQLLEEHLRKKLEEERNKLTEVGGESVDLEFAKEELNRAEEVHDKIATRIEELRTEMSAPERIKLVDKAALPKKPLEAAPYKNLIAAGLGGFLFPFFLALLWEMRIRRIADPEQISQETNLCVLGEITTLPMQPLGAARGHGKRFELYRDTFEESIDYLRTSLLLSHSLDSSQVIAVASATSNEGKSSLASHLAVSLARASQEPVLLIDADMRAPDVHRMFGIAGEPGLAEVLDKRARWSDALVSETGGNLHFLPAGRLSKSPHITLGEGRFASLLNELRPAYRHIVVDAPPVLPAGDALIIAQAADGTLICTMRDVSRGPQIKLACERLARAGARLLGAVLSGVPPQTYVYRYGSYRYSYPRVESNGNGNGSSHAEESIDSLAQTDGSSQLI
ncbi:MAG: polysaccharide biosynthesis tyrosine autokinase [Pirellulales bacterium]|nr:polysaccharide biosynthesis tyrosine autokinase [Pirellulales bacterium]